MKAEIHENEVRLKADTVFDEEVLKKLSNNSIKKVEFEDSWNSKGKLRIIFKSNDWDDHHR